MHSGPQSLFEKTPGSQGVDLPDRHVRADSEYFPLTAEPRAAETPHITTPPTAKQKPMLLLVEDNEINLRVSYNILVHPFTSKTDNHVMSSS